MNDTFFRWYRPLIVLLAAFIFDLLFWKNHLGLNLTLFAMMIAGLLITIGRADQIRREGWIALCGVVIGAVMWYVHGTGVAAFATVSASFIAAAFIHQPQLRSIFYAVLQFLNGLVLVPGKIYDGAGDVLRLPGKRSAGWGWAKAAFIPILIGSIFMLMYREGNSKFNVLTAGIMDVLSETIGRFFEEFFTAHTFFFLFAILLCAALLLRATSRRVVLWEQQWTDMLLRKRVRRPHWLSPLPMDPLERERRKGVMLLVLVNVLLVVVNVIDINWIWFGFEVEEGMSLKAFVHEGTYALIWSILLSIVILMYLFRGNQNFYQRSANMRWLAILWVAQNFILGVSVFLRNYHYISYHGLAYKRLGVIVFLLLVLVGLITLYLKIRDRKSFFYLMRVNMWAAFVVMIGLTLVDWDRYIVRYNLQHDNPAEVDIDNYFLMSDRVLPLLYTDLEKVEAQMKSHGMNRVRWVENLDPNDFRRKLDERRDRFMRTYEDLEWLERTWADDRTYAALKSINYTDPKP
jgi:hypothetical protein